MSEENEKEPGFKVTDKRFSSRISQEVEQNGRTDINKNKVSETEHREDKKKTFREKLFGRKKSDPFLKSDVTEENIDKEFSPSEIDFSSFILSLGTQTMMHLGEVPDPITQEKEKNLDLAKQTIDIIGMLHEKTKNNLTIHEEQLLENLLYELRMKYVKGS